MSKVTKYKGFKITKVVKAFRMGKEYDTPKHRYEVYKVEHKTLPVPKYFVTIKDSKTFISNYTK